MNRLYANCCNNNEVKQVSSMYKLSDRQVILLYNAYMFEESLHIYTEQLSRLKNIGHMFYNTNNMIVDQGFDKYKHDTFNTYLKSIKYNPELISRMISNKQSGYTEIPVPVLSKEELESILLEIEDNI